jgi:hypothetical protein
MRILDTTASNKRANSSGAHCGRSGTMPRDFFRRETTTSNKRRPPVAEVGNTKSQQSPNANIRIPQGNNGTLEKPTAIAAATTTTPEHTPDIATTGISTKDTNRPTKKSQLGGKIPHTTTQPNHATHPTYITRGIRPVEADPGESGNTRDASANVMHLTTPDIHTDRSNTTIASICTNGENRTAVHIPMNKGKGGKLGKMQPRETVE